MHVHIEIQRDDFDLAQEYARLRASATGAGAIVSFCGLVRDVDDSAHIGGLYLEHYPGMTERSLADIAQQAGGRWPIQAISLIHRVGELLPNDQIVLVAVASAHRAAAFSACDFIMDYLKRDAPFWKKERRSDGDRWVEAKSSDLQRADRWNS